MRDDLDTRRKRPPARLSLAVLAWTLLACVTIVFAVHHETRVRANETAQAAAVRDLDRIVRRAADGLHLAYSLENPQLATSVAEALVNREPDLAGLRIELADGATVWVGLANESMPHREHVISAPDSDAELLLLGDRMPEAIAGSSRRLGTVTAYVRAPEAEPLGIGLVSAPLALALGAIVLGFLALALWIRHRVRTLAEVAAEIANGRFEDAKEVRGHDEVAWASLALGELREVVANRVDRVEGRNAALMRDVSLKEDRLDRLGGFASELVAPIAEEAHLDHALAALHAETNAAFSLLFVPQPGDPAALMCEAAVGVISGVDDPRLGAGWFAENLDVAGEDDVVDVELLDIKHPWMSAARRVVPCHGAAAVRLRFKGRLEGVVVIARHTPLSDADRDFLIDAALPFAIAIANRRSYEAVVAMKRALETKNDVLASQRDQLKVVDRMRSQFVANMSHELRTPLNAILGFTELIADGAYGDVNEEQAEPLGNVIEASTNLLTLVNQVLDLSRADAGELQPEYGDCDLRELATEVVRLTDPACRERPYTPEVIGPSVTLRTDAEWVRQILTNLVGNAIKFTNEGSVAVHIVSQFGGGAQVVVEDTGVGIDPAQMELIFEEFRQADGSPTRAHDGVGLGLAISRRLAQAIGGTLSVTSEPGRGSRFTLGLPQSPAQTDGIRRAS